MEGGIIIICIHLAPGSGLEELRRSADSDQAFFEIGLFTVYCRPWDILFWIILLMLYILFGEQQKKKRASGRK